jgi:hypothetical protein
MRWKRGGQERERKKKRENGKMRKRNERKRWKIKEGKTENESVSKNLILNEKERKN